MRNEDILELEHCRGIGAEPEVSEFIRSIPQGSVFYDLGACVGGFALKALLYDLKVVAFEVEEMNYNALIENYIKNKHHFSEGHYFQSIRIGVADKTGKTILRVGQGVPGGHHKTLKLDTYCATEGIIGSEMCEVEIDTLDNLIKKFNLPQPEYLKVDIDGSEYAFIQGAKNTLSKVKSIIIELNQVNEYYPKIVKDLNNLGLFEVSRGEIIDTDDLCNITFSRK